MAKGYKVAGQAAPGANINTDLYTVPSGKQFISSTLTICNRDPSAVASFRIAVVPAGETLTAKHYLDYDTPIESKAPINRVLGMTLAASDKVVIRASSANLSFSLFGSEISP